MKKIITTLAAAIFLLTGLHVAYAQTESTSSYCVDLTVDMGVGATDATTNGQVTKLQDFLIGKGYLVIDNGKRKEAGIGNYGRKTQSAVSRFQNDNGISRTGYVGPLTRANIKTLTCAVGSIDTSNLPSTIIPSGALPILTFTSPVTGAIVIKGEKDIPINWTLADGLLNEFPLASTTIMLSLVGVDGATVATLEKVRLARSNGVSVSAEFDRLLRERGNSNGVPVGQYKLKATLVFRPSVANTLQDQAYTQKAAIYASESGWFSVINSVPKIDIDFTLSPGAMLVPGPATLTWSITPGSSCTLAEGIATSSIPVMGSKVVTPAGNTTYTIECSRVVAWPLPTSSYTTTATSKRTVLIGTPSATITSVNLTTDQKRVTVRGTAGAAHAIRYVVMSPSGVKVHESNDTVSSSGAFSKIIDLSSLASAPGTYTIQVFVPASSTSVASSHQFTIGTAPTATIGINSPNGGETYKVGDKVNIQWSTTRTSNATVALVLVDQNNVGRGVIAYVPSSSLVQGNNSREWTINYVVQGGDVMEMVSPGTYKIEAILYEGDVSCLGFCAPGTNQNPTIIARDSSNALFTIRPQNDTTPFIGSISPTSGQVGTVVTVQGTGFTPTGNSVYLNNGTAASLRNLYSNGTTLTFTIPATLSPACTLLANNPCTTPPSPTPSSVNVIIENANGTSNSKNFSVTSLSAATPAITSISPNSVSNGQEVTVTGTGFNASSVVSFYQNGVSIGAGQGAGTNLSVSNNGTTIKFTPLGLAAGVYQIKVRNVVTGQFTAESNSVSFTVTPTPPCTNGILLPVPIPYVGTISTCVPATLTVTSSSLSYVSGMYTSMPTGSKVLIINKTTDQAVGGYATNLSSAQTSGTVTLAGLSLSPGTYALRAVNASTGSTIVESSSFTLSDSSLPLAPSPVRPVCGLFRGGTASSNMVSSPNPATSVADTDSACVAYCDQSNPVAGDMCRRGSTTLKTYSSTASPMNTYQGFRADGVAQITTTSMSRTEALAHCTSQTPLVLCKWGTEIIYTRAVFAPIVTLKASPTSISPSQSSTLSWTTNGAGPCTLENTTAGTVESISGTSKVVSPAQTSTYKVTCKNFGYVANSTTANANGLTSLEASKTVTVTVKSQTVSVGTYVLYVDGSSNTTSTGVTEKQALDTCTQAAKGYLTKSVRCTWNDKEIYSHNPGFVPAPVGTYKIYIGTVGSSPDMTTTGITEKAALDNCTYTASKNPTKAILCYWNDKKIYSYTPPSASTDSCAVLDATKYYTDQCCTTNTGTTRCGTQNRSADTCLALTAADYYTNQCCTTLTGVTRCGTKPLSSNVMGPIYAMDDAGVVLGASNQCIDLGSNMHRGYESASVTKLQGFLKGEGLLDEVTGFYGDKTVAAVKAYQESKGLPMTGMVYTFTRAAIKSDTCQ